MQKKKWKLRNAPVDKAQVLALSKQYDIPPFVASILLKRGVESFEEYMSPALSKLQDPFLMKDMDKAVRRLVHALDEQETIAIYGDYDVDGITSTAILTHFLRARGAKSVLYYIPDRLQEGYGVNNRAIDDLAAAGVTLLITVDCGITAVNEVLHAKELGMDVIVTDHHECKDALPAAVAVLNPKQPDCTYPFKKLAGIGVVFKLLQAMTLTLKCHMQALYDEYLDIVALGTIADVMPLTGENRIIVKNGLEQMKFSANRGIRALIEQVELDARYITTGTVGFTLAPRINAAGRVGSPKLAVELLLSNDEQNAKLYAGLLNDENHQRQEAEQRIIEEALSALHENKSFEQDAVLVLAKENWHQGIIGIVASKITEQFNKPCILISLENGMGKGSGRSIKGFNLFAALSVCSEHLVKFGGHELAAGLTIAEEQVDHFRRAINTHARAVLSPEDFIPELIIDAELPLPYMNLNTADKIAILAPHGMGNPCPVFLGKGLQITGVRTMSDGKHLRLNLTDGRCAITAIGFGMGKVAKQLNSGEWIDMVFQLETNMYKGERRVQILLKDLRPSLSADSV